MTDYRSSSKGLSTMKVTFSVVPPGGGEQDFSFDVDIPALPETGDYITANDGKGGDQYYIVRRRWFYLDVRPIPGGASYAYKTIIVEVEFAKGVCPSKSHIAICEMYENRGKVPKEFDASTY
jgi:hypothetical protein